MSHHQNQLSEMVRFRAPDGFGAMLAEAAAREFSNSSEFIRRAVVERLRSVGIDPHEIRKRASERRDATHVRS
jgi:hypothetical protein